jgi:cytosine/creatinine deaminase
MMVDLLLKNAKLERGVMDVEIVDGKISSIAPNLEIQAAKTIDLERRLLLPGLIETHCHIDKTLTADRVENAAGTLMGAIQNWIAFKPKITKADYLERGKKALAMAISHGTTTLRTHVDVDSNGFLALESMLELKELFADKITIQIVALGNPELEFETMREAMRIGADVVGGCPAIRENPKLEVENALKIAAEFGKPVDLHVDENDFSNSLEFLADEVLRLEFDLPVMAGHCCSLDFMIERDAARVIEKVARAGISIVSLPACNLNLQGRGVHPVPRGVTQVLDLLTAGVNVCVGSDNVQDPFHPIGNYSLVSSANLATMACHMTTDIGIQQAFEMISSNAARALNLPKPEIKVGANADLIVLEVGSAKQAIREIAPCFMTIKGGKMLERRSWTS